MSGISNPAAATAVPGKRSKLSRNQITGFWAAWTGWTLDGMDSFIYALVLSPALTELLPKSGMDGSPANVGLVGSILFALFLVGWGLAFIWGPIADRFGRTRVLAASVVVYAVFTGAAALSQNVWQLGLFRLLAGIGIGGEWALAGTYVAEAWPEDRRKMGAGYLQTGYYTGFFLAAALNFTVGAHFGWRAMFLCGLAPVLLSLYIVFKVKEPEKWAKNATAALVKASSPLAQIFNAQYRRRTIVNAALLTVAIIGLWAGAVYEPSAIISLAKKEGMDTAAAVRTASLGTGLLSIGTILGCLLAPFLAERVGRRKTLAFFFIGMAVCIWLSFGWAFYLPNGLVPFIAVLFFLGFFGGNFAIFSLWLPEQYGTVVRATAFAFATSFGRLIGAGVNFLLGNAIHGYGSLGIPVATTALAFLLGLLIIPFAMETKGLRLPD
ncbi:MFS transporter [Nevskia soli]|uniref:MFS transporter n=1 Tax=Nevskia soli TaxID=418856 RepID=UPI0004A6E155|nr:MFS transporter [Nevskia soli]